MTSLMEALLPGWRANSSGFSARADDGEDSAAGQVGSDLSKDTAAWPAQDDRPSQAVSTQVPQKVFKTRSSSCGGSV